jgi:hypothetical protein
MGEAKKRDNDADAWGGPATARAAGAKRFAEPPPPRPTPSAPASTSEAPRPSKPERAPMNEGAGSDRVERRKAFDDLLREPGHLMEGTGPMKQSSPAPAAAQPADEKSKAIVHAPATRPASSPSGMSAPAPAPMLMKDEAMSESSAEAEVAERAPARTRAAAPAPAAVAAAPAFPITAAAPKSALGKRGADKEAPQAVYEDESDERLAKGNAAPSFDESLRKADRLFAEQNWAAAADAYRDLLRRYPSHKDAPKWRARMDQSIVAERERRNTGGGKDSKAKQTSADAPQGGKK